jgi:homogentisate 1,2-dioxygenase
MVIFSLVCYNANKFEFSIHFIITDDFKLICFVFPVPQQGTLKITTEFGKMNVAPNEICVIQVNKHSY